MSKTGKFHHLNRIRTKINCKQKGFISKLHLLRGHEKTLFWHSYTFNKFDKSK